MVLEQLPEVARKKKKGDYLVDNRMYVNAIRIYEDALRSVDTGGLGGQYEGKFPQYGLCLSAPLPDRGG